MPTRDLICEACLDDENVCLLVADGLTLRHCSDCRLTSVVNPVTTAVYDAAYVAERYDRYETTDRMSRLRGSYVETILRLNDALPRGHSNHFAGGAALLDVGYGNGSFLRAAAQNGWVPFGNDVNPTEYEGVIRRVLPDPLTTREHYRVITFWDALEHFEHLQQVRRVSACTDWIFVTAPLPPREFPGEHVKTWLQRGHFPWKHFRPGEHHHYFHPSTLEEIFTWEDEVAGIRTVATLMHLSHFEDAIRGSAPDGRFNTFTAALRCQTFTGPSAAR